MIEGLRSFVREFTETYVYLPGYTDHTVEKICHMCNKSVQVTVDRKSSSYVVMALVADTL